MPYVVQLSYYDPAIPGETTISFARGAGLALPDTDWIAPGLISWGSPTQKVALGANGVVSADTDKGSVVISNPPLAIDQPGPFDGLINKVFQTRLASLFWVTTTWAGRTLIDTANLEQPIPTFNLGSGLEATTMFPLRDPRSSLTGDLQPNVYAGTNSGGMGVEGDAGGIKGKPKPIMYGIVSNIPGVLVNSSLLIYQLADVPVTVDCIRDGGVSTFTGGVVRASLASLQATSPGSGKYDLYSGPEGSFVRLGSSPVYAITFDAHEAIADSDHTAAQIWKRVGKERCGRTDANIEAAAITAADALDGGAMGFWWADAITQKDALDEVLSRFSGFEVYTSASAWRIKKLVIPAASDITKVDLAVLSPALRATAKTRSLSSASVARPDYAPDGAPPYKVNVSWGRNYLVMAASDFAGSAVQRLKDKFSTEWRVTSMVNSAIWNPSTKAGPWPNAPTLDVYSGYQQNSSGLCPAADTEASRISAMVSVLRQQWTISFPAMPTDDVATGDIVSMTLAAYGLSAGAKFVVLQSSVILDADGLERQMVLGLQRLASDP